MEQWLFQCVAVRMKSVFPLSVLANGIPYIPAIAVELSVFFLRRA
jgi:hypothetical protein